MKKELPEKMRAFGIELTRRAQSVVLAYYTGSRDGYEVTLVQCKDGTWRAQLSINDHQICPHLTSSSPAAAIRNLRGTALNLASSIGKIFPRRKA